MGRRDLCCLTHAEKRPQLQTPFMSSHSGCTISTRLTDDNARAWLRKLDGLMESAGLSDPSDEGLWTVKARSLSLDQRLELSSITDELANWFDRKFWEDE